MLYNFYPTPKQDEMPGFSLIERSIVGIFQGFSNGELPIYPSQKFLMKELGCSKITVVRAIKKLCDEGVISKKRRGQGKTNFYQLLPLKSLKVRRDTSAWDASIPLTDPYNILKENISCGGSDLPCGEASPPAGLTGNRKSGGETPPPPLDDFSSTPERIVAVFDELAKINPNQHYGNKTQRAAITKMIKNRGFEKTMNLAQYVVENNGKEFFPVINDPLQMANRYNSIVIYSEKH